MEMWWWWWWRENNRNVVAVVVVVVVVEGKLMNFVAFKTISMRIMLAFSQSTFCS